MASPWRLSLLCFALLACGGQAFDSDANGDSSNGGNANTGGVSNAGTANGGGADQCAEFADDPSPGSVAIAISNQTSQPIHVGTAEPANCTSPPLFRVHDAAGENLAETAYCRNPCSAAMQGGPAAGCPALCAFPQAVTLAPSEGTHVIWEALYMESTFLPEECSASGDSVSCDRLQRIEPGMYTFSATAGTELDCSQTLGDCGQCIARGDGGCSQPATVGGTLLMAETTVQLDASYGITGSTAAGADIAAPGPTLSVELIFTDP